MQIWTQFGAAVAVMGLIGAIGCGKKADAPPVETTAAAEGTAAATAAGEADTAVTEPVKPKGQELAPEGADFRLVFPAGPSAKPTTQDIPTPAGNMTARIWMQERSDGSVYIANYTDVPADLVAGGDFESLLSEGKKGALATINGKTTREEKFEKDGHPGLRYWFEGNAQGITVYGRTEAVFVTPRLYQVQFIGMSKGAVESAQTTDFFDSFALTKAREQADAQKVTSEEGGFSVTFPVSYPAPSKTAEEIELPMGKTTMTMLMATTDRGALGVGSMPLPEGVTPTDVSLDDARDGLVKATGATVDKEEDFERGEGVKARRVWFSGTVEGQTFHGRADIFSTRGHLYVIQALAPTKEQLDRDQVAQYFDSFELTVD